VLKTDGARFDDLCESAWQQLFKTSGLALGGEYRAEKNCVATGLLEAVVSETKRRGLARHEVIEQQARLIALEYFETWDGFCLSGPDCGEQR
jgi:hypothetical protein